MTHEDDTRNLVRRAGDELPLAAAPVDDLIHLGRRARRRRAVTIVGVGASVAVVTSGAFALGSQLSHDASNNPIVSTPPVTSPNPSPSNTSATLTPPPGTRLVGINGIGIAVPALWGTNDGSCHSAYKDTVIVGANAGVDCAMVVPPPVSWAILDSYESSIRELTQSQGSEIEIGGLSVRRVATYTYQQGEAGANTMHAGALLSKRLDIAIIVRSPDPAVINRVLASAFALPGGYLAIPPDPTGAAILHLGITVHHALRYDAHLRPGTPMGSDPPVGSVVPRGSVVTVLSSTRQQHESSGCGGLQVALRTRTTRIPITSPGRTYHLDLTVGDTIALEASGPCAAQLSLSPTTDVLGGKGLNRVVAVRPGTAKIYLTIPMCAGTSHPRCIGGIATLGTVTVRVQP